MQGAVKPVEPRCRFRLVRGKRMYQPCGRKTCQLSENYCLAHFRMLYMSDHPAVIYDDLVGYENQQPPIPPVIEEEKQVIEQGQVTSTTGENISEEEKESEELLSFKQSWQAVRERLYTV